MVTEALALSHVEFQLADAEALQTEQGIWDDLTTLYAPELII
ncbi:hypothetical protein [Allocoleopsis sp.]